MQAVQSSRPASGAEHQFSHLWDMEHLRYNGASVSHGFKVGIGTLASTALFEMLLEAPVEQARHRPLCRSVALRGARPSPTSGPFSATIPNSWPGR